ncbi:PQQ-binding-like beta-propeller repeat protein [Armatimonas sp.]|uniref:PQQ-binding-like beta-propeller repeat protein n=1 Tax=Armatimonas sp. TaxID=1872638 RepID=UPI003753A280
MAKDWLQYAGPNRDFSVEQTLPKQAALTVKWRRALGEGTSGIVGDGKSLFTLYSTDISPKREAGVEVVVALDAATGKTRWEQKTPVAMLPKQESYTSDPIRPQATPLLWQGKLLTLGFTGLLKCFDAATGRVLWEHNLVTAFEATPVQFGFSASPLLSGGAFVVHVGGKQASLIAFEPRDGNVRWKSAPAEPSYASSMPVRVDGEDQLIQLTRDALLGVAAKDGAPRWSYPLPKLGLTNVPTPLVLSDQRLVISGQGILGTRLLKLSRTQAPTEVWVNTKTTFFYTNWTANRELVYGCNNGGFVSALRLTDGQELWKERGQNDANLLQVGDTTLFLRGDGLLTRA